MKIERSVNERKSDGESQETAEENRTSSRQRKRKDLENRVKEKVNIIYYIMYHKAKGSCHNHPLWYHFQKKLNLFLIIYLLM